MLAFLLLACTETAPAPSSADTAEIPDSGTLADPAELAPGPACPHPANLYDPTCVVRYDIAVAEADWAAMQTAYDKAVANCWDTAHVRDKYPATLTYGAESIDVGIRLKGNACTFLPGGKLQFRIDVDWVNPEATFHGVTSINLEAANYDPTGQKNGLAYSVFREVGIVSPEANFATLYVNGDFYAAYENIEQINGHFLDRHYEDDTGNLYFFIWDGHYGELRTNEEIGDVSRWTELESLVSATPDSVSWAEFEARIPTLIDVDELLLALATEAVVPQVDGVWAGSANCYVYDNPLGCGGTGCFEYLPWDMDSAFVAPPLDLCPACGSSPETEEADPITFISGRGPARKWRLFDLLMEVPDRRSQFVDDLAVVLDTAYDPATLEARHAERFAQLEPWNQLDPKVDYARFVESNAELSALFADRRAFLETWIAANR